MGGKRKTPGPKPKLTFDLACSTLETTLRGTTRREILDELWKPKNFGLALRRLRDSMRTNVFRLGERPLPLDGLVRTFDERTRADGFHVLHDWDGTIDQLNPETIPVDVVHFLMTRPDPGHSQTVILAILMDYYFLYILALLSLRVWDEGDPNENLGRLTRLIEDLEGPQGSGQTFVENAETLILLATSHFEPDAKAYDRLLERLSGLSPAHRRNAALVVAGVLSSHLRFGFGATYARDLRSMREDNAPDYPWLSFALSNLMEAYRDLDDRGIEGAARDKIVEGLLNGLSPDTRAFLDDPPAALSAHEAERARFRELFDRYRDDLLVAFEGHRPSERHYSPISLFFNFLHNILKAVVVDALLRGEPWTVRMNDLLTGIPRGSDQAKSRESLARTLMGYARASPDKIRGRPVPVIVYDPRAGRQAYIDTLHRLRHLPRG